MDYILSTVKVANNLRKFVSTVVNAEQQWTNTRLKYTMYSIIPRQESNGLEIDRRLQAQRDEIYNNHFERKIRK